MRFDGNNKEVGNRIKQIRRNLGLTMESFAHLVDPNAKSGTVSNWETGKNLPNNRRLTKIAKIGGITIDELLYGSITGYVLNNLDAFIPNEFQFLLPAITVGDLKQIVDEINNKKLAHSDIVEIEAIIAKELPKIANNIEKMLDNDVSSLLKHENEFNEVYTTYLNEIGHNQSKYTKEKALTLLKKYFHMPLEMKVKHQVLFEDLRYYLGIFTENVSFMTHHEASVLDREALLLLLKNPEKKLSNYSDSSISYIVSKDAVYSNNQFLLIDNNTLKKNMIRSKNTQLLIPWDKKNMITFNINAYVLVLFEGELTVGFCLDEEYIEIHSNNVHISELEFAAPILTMYF
ncbi:helix-turn-helix domain-containing protein [Listeria grandensis]|uniref:helix-turn-helix domain-containing protein n=1 Tax=Listeria grandensis TaxID=1494963 RepID=UPI00164EB710|nr:helix-turn-helix transcriptional regulator [Listeria grandensis]MBC6315291.1 helix-turn-helix transcriptional regulator [Listeria grandensis]